MTRAEQQILVFLNPGEYFVGDARHRIRTLLGSCVSITLWHAGLRVGAMSHFLLADRSNRASAELDARYGAEALQLMETQLMQYGVRLPDCEAKIFGGGDMFPKQRGQGAPANVGRKNGEAARRLLEARGVRILAESLFGEGHRRILFDVGSGHVWARQLKIESPSV